MPLFGKKKDAAVETVPAKVVKASLPTDVDTSTIIKGLRLSEKTVNLGDQNVYTFNVRKDANKHQVKAAVQALYNVTPVKVNIVNKKAAKRTKGLSGKIVHEKGAKKAYVYLKEGDTITLV